jgi:hypothetical protein
MMRMAGEISDHGGICGGLAKLLRIHKIGEVYSLTCSFSGPDGRALFTIGPDADGEPVLTWLTVGTSPEAGQRNSRPSNVPDIRHLSM